MILDTTFLIDLEREQRAGTRGAAHRFLAEREETAVAITVTVAGELAAGIAERARWEVSLAPFTVLGPTPDVWWEYGRIFRYLRTNGRLIGANDLWIAATALVHDRPVVTRNVQDYQRVPGLNVLGY